ncbi:hypothetical protein H3J60_004546 [Salmonella enterica]|nr:hypothetical protein [Salmonella enterica]
MTDKYKAMPDALILDLNSAYPIFEDIEMALGGTGRITFEDGTQQFVDEEGSVFSPRLPEKALAAFCEEHLETYLAFHSDNARKIVRCEPLTMKPFWEPAQ